MTRPQGNGLRRCWRCSTGRQTVLLRKGGIHEKRFELTAREFVLFPTVAHGHAERVRGQAPGSAGGAAADSTDTQLVVRVAARWLLPWRSIGPNVSMISPICNIWTNESVHAPSGWTSGPRHRLTVLVVQASPLTVPVAAPARWLRRLQELVDLDRSRSCCTRSAIRPNSPRSPDRVRRSVG